MQYKIFSYINKRFENDGVLVDADEVYEVFQLEFDNGTPVELIDEVMNDFIGIHDLSGIDIQYEGEIRAGGANLTYSF